MSLLEKLAAKAAKIHSATDQHTRAMAKMKISPREKTGSVLTSALADVLEKVAKKSLPPWMSKKKDDDEEDEKGEPEEKSEKEEKGEEKEDGEKKEKSKKVEPGSLKGGKNEPSSKDKPGEGGRFSALKKKLSHKKGVKNPGALSAALGRAKFGKGKMQRMAAAGK